MSDGLKPNLEPIDEADLDLEHKFKVAENPVSGKMKAQFLKMSPRLLPKRRSCRKI